MSIRTFNKFINNSGCVVILSVALAVVFLVSFLGMGMGGPSGQQGDTKGSVVVTAFGQTITDDMIQDSYNAATSQLGSTGAPTPDQMLTAYQAVFTQTFNPAATLAIAKQNGIQITDADLTDAYNASVGMQMMQAKYTLMMQGKLKASATEADFEAAYKAATGSSVQDAQKQGLAAFQAALKDAAKRNALLLQFAPNIVPSKLGALQKPTADQLKATLVTITAKRVFITGANADSTASTVESDAKSGTPFEQLITKYSQDTTNNGKNPADQTFTVASQDLQSEPLNALVGLKAGDVSKPIHTEGGTAVYKVIKVTPNVPKDFDKNQATLLKQYANTLGQSQYTTQLDSLLKSPALVWKSPEFKALYDVIEATGKKDANWSALAAEAKKYVNGQPTSVVGAAGAAALAYYDAVKTEYMAAKADQQKALFQDRVDSINFLNQSAPSPGLSIEAAELFATNKQGGPAAQMLLQAANMNTDTSAAGTRVYEQIQGDLAAFKKQKLLTDDQADSIQKALTSYQQQMVEVMKEKAQYAAQQKQIADQQAADKAKYDKERQAAQGGNAGAAASAGTQTGVTPGSMPLKGEGSTAPAKGAPAAGTAGASGSGAKKTGS